MVGKPPASFNRRAVCSRFQVMNVVLLVGELAVETDWDIGTLDHVAVAAARAISPIQPQSACGGML